MKYNFLLLILIIIVLASSLVFAESAQDFQGVWVATVLNLDYPSKPGITNAELRTEADRILDQVQAMGMNAVVLQVRPAADAFYESDIFPWSKYLSGKQGVGPTGGFDPLQYWIEEAHKRNIEIHAWINPYRITRKTSNEPEHDFIGLSSSHPAVENPQWVVKHTDGNLYFNPGIPEVIDLIVSGVTELIENYDVDGVHFDDYFYPGTEFGDADTFRKYGSGYKSIHDWRRANVNKLIEQTHKAIDRTNPSVQFGVSPFAIWLNDKNSSLGSATNGLESYTSHYADSRLWVKNQWIDYIAPQIYWHIGYNVADYEVLLNWWDDVVDNSDVDLYVGHAAYRVENSSKTSPWHGVSEIEKQLSLNKSKKNVSGSIYFRYGFFENHYTLRELIKAHNLQNQKLENSYSLIVGRPVGKVKTSSDAYFIGGSSNPDLPLTLNGIPISNRTLNGYFGVYVELKPGINKFTFMQEGVSVVKEIERLEQANPKPMTDVKIEESSVFPKSDAIYQPGETIRFKAIAPAGAEMTVYIDGSAFPMDKNNNGPQNDMTPMLYYYDYMVPDLSGSSEVINLGKIIYKMNFGSTTDEIQSKGIVEIYKGRVPVIASINSEYADSYKAPTTSEGAHYLLNRGMTDLVTGKVDGFIRLSSGIWVKEDSVIVEKIQIMPWLNIAKLSNDIGNGYEDIVIETNQLPVAGASYDGNTINLEVARTLIVAVDLMKNQSVIESIKTESVMDKSIVSVVVKDPNQLGGYELLNEDGKLILRLYKRFKIVSSEYPLKGALIVLDPGHGGSDTGAIGLQGDLNTEKTINLSIASYLKALLESYGATVYMTREGDNSLSLKDRLLFSKASRPDLFLSLHADSTLENIDLNNVKGFSAFYKDPVAKELADTIQNTVIQNLNRNNRKVKNNNFYVLRGTWTPSVLIETGFVTNPVEYEWMMNSDEQKLFSHVIAESIIEYFR